MSDILTVLSETIDRRLSTSDVSTSYTAELASAGPTRVAQKVGEEGVELALAIAMNSRSDAINEAADLIYHVLVALRLRNITLQEVLDELARRHAG